MTSDDITDFIATMPDVLSNWAIIVDHLKDAADEIDRLSARSNGLESFAKEMWNEFGGVVRSNATTHFTAGSSIGEQAKELIAKARELGIEE